MVPEVIMDEQFGYDNLTKLPRPQPNLGLL